MNFLGVCTLEKVLVALRAGQPVDGKLLGWAEKAVAREKEILTKRARRSAEFFNDRAATAAAEADNG